VSRIGGVTGRARAARRGGVWRPGGVPVNTAVSGFRTIVRAVAGFALLPLLVHRIGAGPAGLFFFATTLTGYFTAVEYGLATSVTKYVAEYRAGGSLEPLGSVLKGSMLLMAGIGAAIAIVLTVLAFAAGTALFNEPSLHDEVVPTLLVAAATALLFWPSRLGPAALEGLERYDLSATVQIASTVVSFAGLAALMTVTHDVAVLTAYFGAVLVLEGIVAAALAWRTLAPALRLGRWWGSHLKPVVGFGASLFAIGMADTIVYSLDRTIVAAFVGAAAIVAYEVGLRPHNGIRSISALAGGALLSTVSRLAAQQRERPLQELILIGSFIGVIITTPVAILVLVLAPEFVQVWLGDDFVRYAVYAQIFSSYWLVHSNTGVLGSAIVGVGKIRVFVIITLVSALVTLVLSVVMTAIWGTVGVIWGTVIPSWIGFPIWMHFALRHVGVSASTYMRSVILPAYVPMAVWCLVVLGLKQLVSLDSLFTLALFGGGLLVLFWAAMVPLIRTRWRAALAAAGEG
jgi:O-antigen/teichoic acid export membrane protein